MKKIEITSKTIIYICSPAYFKTGGPELLHQFYAILKKENLNVKLVYYGKEIEKGINPEFRCYASTYITEKEIVDDKNNVLIVPEVFTREISKFHEIRKIIWWTSVDNYLFNRSLKFRLKNYGIISAIKLLIKTIICHPTVQLSIERIRKETNLNFVQSIYAQKFLESQGVQNIYFLSDYINDKYLSESEFVDFNHKQNLVCYNPKKGIKFTKLLIKKSNFCFVPLINMTNEQVIENLKKAKVYIDFGNHPGKDRIPREAACLGCCVITDYKGSAKFYSDVSISDHYKFFDCEKNVPNVLNKINYCFQNYNSAYKEFSEYIKKIKQEKKQFEEDSINWFSK